MLLQRSKFGTISNLRVTSPPITWIDVAVGDWNHKIQKSPFPVSKRCPSLVDTRLIPELCKQWHTPALPVVSGSVSSLSEILYILSHPEEADHFAADRLVTGLRQHSSIPHTVWVDATLFLSEWLHLHYSLHRQPIPKEWIENLLWCASYSIRTFKKPTLTRVTELCNVLTAVCSRLLLHHSFIASTNMSNKSQATLFESLIDSQSFIQGLAAIRLQFNLQAPLCSDANAGKFIKAILLAGDEMKTQTPLNTLRQLLCHRGLVSHETALLSLRQVLRCRSPYPQLLYWIQESCSLHQISSHSLEDALMTNQLNRLNDKTARSDMTLAQVYAWHQSRLQNGVDPAALWCGWLVYLLQNDEMAVNPGVESLLKKLISSQSLSLPWSLDLTTSVTTVLAQLLDSDRESRYVGIILPCLISSVGRLDKDTVNSILDWSTTQPFPCILPEYYQKARNEAISQYRNVTENTVNELPLSEVDETQGSLSLENVRHLLWRLLGNICPPLSIPVIFQTRTQTVHPYK